MKFHNGAWLMKKDHELFWPKTVYETEITDETVVLVAPTKGFDLQSVVLTLLITCPLPGMIRVQTYHYMGICERKNPSFDLHLSENVKMTVSDTEKEITVENGGLSLTVNKENFNMVYKRDGKEICTSSGRDLAYVKTDWHGDAYSYNGEDAYMRQQLSLGVGELIYGLGERFTPFVRNGQSVDIWNEDGGTATAQSYKNIPFYLSNRGYGIFVNHTERVSFEIGSEYVTKAAFSVPGEKLDYFFIDGPKMTDVLRHYTNLTGKPARMPEWSFGLWLSTSFITKYDEETVLGFIDGMQSRNIPLSVFHFDCLWMKNFHWTDFIWDQNTFPDPEGMIRKIHDKGIKVCVWINPYVGQRSALFAEGVRLGYFLKRPNGDVWQWDLWQPGLAIVDFTNPDACKWYQNGLKKLLDMGVDCFKTDFGERIPTDAVYANGADPLKMHNYYTELYNRLVFETLEEEKRKGEAVLFARSATAGGQRYPVHWGGDCTATYESMAESLRGGLSLTSSGFGFWSHDIGGFEDNSTPDLYMRWAAFGLLSTHSRLHGSLSYRVPWNYGEEAVSTLRYFTELKMSLMPYIYSQAVLTSETGIPMMRSMAIAFTDDRNCDYLDRQYMFGDSLLIAPIFNDSGLGSFYLPNGRWTDYLSGEIYEGGRWYEKTYDYQSLPILVKENSIIAVNTCTTSGAEAQIEYRIYELNHTAEASVYRNGLKVASVKALRSKDEIHISVQNESPYSLRLVGQRIEACYCAAVHHEAADTILKPDKGTQNISCTIAV